MRYFKCIKSGYILAIGTDIVGDEITQSEYELIKSVIATRPTTPEGYGCRLTTELTWEQYAFPPEPIIEEPPTPEDYEEALSRLGVS